MHCRPVPGNDCFVSQNPCALMTEEINIPVKNKTAFILMFVTLKLSSKSPIHINFRSGFIFYGQKALIKLQICDL
jgi:hypothetical protein